NNSRTEITEIVLRLVQTNLWSPVEATDLLKRLVEKCQDDTAVLKTLHIIELYHVSEAWQDENGRTVCQFLESVTPEDLLKELDCLMRKENNKSLEIVLDEIREGGWLDDIALKKVHDIVKAVQDQIKKQESDADTKAQGDEEIIELQKHLEKLCRAVHQCKHWWPRVTQMISWCLLALSKSGNLLEMETGEGKSCVIAMFAAMRVMKGEKVDIVSSSSVLSQRDAQEWEKFYKVFNITVDTNTDKATDESRYKCYQSDIVYGTVETFAADFLRQDFEQKNIRPNRKFQCIIVDEVDFLLLDHGVQLTYLSSDITSLQHLSPVLAMIWSAVSQYALVATNSKTFLRGPPLPFYRTLYDMIDTETLNIENPIQLLQIAEDNGLVPLGFTQDLFTSDKNKLKHLINSVNQDTMLSFFSTVEQYLPYQFIPYILDNQGCLHINLSSNKEEKLQTSKDAPTVPFLVLEDGLCCSLYESEDIINPSIVENIRQHIYFTSSDGKIQDRLSMPGFLQGLIEEKLATWIQNAFIAIKLQEGREYLVQNNQILPVDFKSTGIVELNKKWGDGLQQFLEMKHLLTLSTMSTITNFISNVSYFRKYKGQIYGTTGTLGTESDLQFLIELYPSLSACRIPSFNRKKLFEIKGILKNSTEEWKDSISSVLKKQINPTTYRNGRAALVICEDINIAREIHEMITGEVPGKAILYIRNDNEVSNISDYVLSPGDVIVATNLAGRGTDIRVSKEVNDNGGLFVILTFLSQSTRVELQAFGRTARKGQPGSVQCILCSNKVPLTLQGTKNIDDLKDRRDLFAKQKVKHVMKYDIPEVILREKLFSEYCKILFSVYQEITDKEDRTIAVAIMNEYWGTWLQIKSEQIVQLKEIQLLNNLQTDIGKAKYKSETNESPLSSIYHYIRIANQMLFDEKIEESARLFKKAMDLDKTWAAIAFYNHAYCTIRQRKENYLEDSITDLEEAKKSLLSFTEAWLVTAQLVMMSNHASNTSNEKSNFQKNTDIKCQVLKFFEKNITSTIKKLEEIKER
uniref:Uncharacterized protein n=1 Tax=Latimeria chalumnae TaxID=7897 RepID=H3B1F6_LATCH